MISFDAPFAERLTAAVSEGVWVLGRDGVTTFASERMHAILGITPKALAGRSFLSFTAVESRPIAEQMIERCRAGAPAGQSEIRLARASGGEIAALISMVPLPEGTLATVLDITERKQLQVLFALRDRLQRARSFDEIGVAAFDAMQATLEIARASIQIFDASGASKFVARRGLSDEYVRTIQTRWRSTFDPKHPTTFISSDLANDATREPIWREIVAEGIGSLVSIPMVAQSRLLGRFVLYDAAPRRFTKEELELAETITNNVAFAIDRMQAESALRAGMSQLELALGASDTGTWGWDLTTGRVTWDARMHQLFGISPEAFEGSFESVLARVHPYDRSRLSLETKRKGGELDERFRIVRPDGAIRQIRARGRVLHDTGGKLTAVAGVCRDITEEHQREQTQKLESLGVLAGGIAHDFNNLLAGILGTVDIARHGMQSGRELQEALAYIETAAQRAANLAQQMLAYSGRGRVVVQPVDVSELVEEMAQLLATVISKKAEMKLELPRDLSPVEGDPTQLRQVIMNLITNASDALDGRAGNIRLKTGRLTITDRSELSRALVGEDLPPGKYVMIEVTDTGCGMEPEALNKIFEPFYTTKFSGRGLGLATVLGIVRGHHGAILVDTEVGRGTVFTILLPPAAETATILLVDDERVVRHVASRILVTGGFRVLSAADGAEAIAQLSSNRRIDLAVVDMTMPRMNGDEVVRELRRLQPDLLAIISSGFAPPSPDELPENTHFIGKPYSPAELLAKVRLVLDQAERSAASAER